jgi:hypothetical protein
VVAVPDHWPLLPGIPRSPTSGTNAFPAKAGMIAELSFAEDPEAARVTLSQIVKDLKQQSIFSRVDLLSDDLRRPIADPKTILADRDFVLVLDFAETDFLLPTGAKKAPVRSVPKRALRQGNGDRDPETASQGIP